MTPCIRSSARSTISAGWSRACAGHGMEIALDFAVQCSPDHPWLKEHPEWFKRRPDGSIQYAENPPKKYEDIVNPEFYGAGSNGVWTALRDVVLFWVEQGVRIFRVDNPHTKPFPFWEWLIREVQAVDPNVIFLAEAFTRPKVMKALAKLGFSQSYTYFTWRTGKEELQAYLSEITGYPEREYFRPNFFVNTPDILPFHLQSGEPWMFKARVALAATLSGNYGIYNGFELLEHEPHSRKGGISQFGEIRAQDPRLERARQHQGLYRRLNRIRRAIRRCCRPAICVSRKSTTPRSSAYVKESVGERQCRGGRDRLDKHGRASSGSISGRSRSARRSRRRVGAIENLVTGERHMIEWGGVRLRIDPRAGSRPALPLLWRDVGATP